jgi:hypothetical protein
VRCRGAHALGLAAATALAGCEGVLGFPEDMHFGAGGGTSSGQGATATVASGGASCASEDRLADDLKDGASAKWEQDDGSAKPCTIGVKDGALELTAGPAPAYAACRLSTPFAYDLSLGMLALEVLAIPQEEQADDDNGLTVGAKPIGDWESSLEIVIKHGAVMFSRDVGEAFEWVAGGSFQWTLGQHRFVAIRSSPDSVTFETSADGVGWVVRGTTGRSGLFDLSRVEINIVVATQGNAPAATARLGLFDSTLCPSP